jgi:GIY-YIG catalytic domain
MRTCLLAKEKKSTLKKDKDKEKDKDKDNDKDTKQNQHFCYILQKVGKPHLCNYVGYTVNFGRRIRQHNSSYGAARDSPRTAARGSFW